MLNAKYNKHFTNIMNILVYITGREGSNSLHI